MTAKTITAADIDLLISRSQIVVRQKHRRTEGRVRQERAAVAAADKGSAQRERELSPGITKIKTAGVRSAVERTVADQRRKCSDRNGGKQRIERGEKLVTGKRMADDPV